MHILEIRGRKLEFNEEQFETHKRVKVLFKNEKGEEMELTPTQCDIFNDIYKRRHPRIHLMAHTRFGKSMTVAMAVLLRVATFPEKWSILAPSTDKARIIMDYILQHAFDNDYFKQKLIIDKGESLESLRRKRTKDRINFKHSDGTLGEVFIIGVDASNSQKAGEAAMGFGAANVILDEAALVGDEIEGKVFRMLADNADDYFYCKIGNPFTRGHFLKDTRDDRVFCRNIDSKIGVREGRLTEDYLAIAKMKPNYDILFNNIFPAADMVDKDGWSPLLTDDEIENAMIDKNLPMFGTKRLGLDVAEGGENFNCFALRSENFALVLRKDQEKSLMATVGNTVQICKKLDIPYEEVFIDAIGVGSGVVDRFIEQRLPVKGIKVSTSPIDKVNFYNLRAESYWRLRDWIKAGGKLKRHADWWQLAAIKYKVRDSSGNMVIMSKDEMRKKGIESPDVADALMLTFAFPKSHAVQAQMRRAVKRITRVNEDDGYSFKMC